MNCAMGASDTDLLDGIVGPREQRDSGAARGQGGTAELAAGPCPGSSQRPRAHARTKGRSQAQSPGPPSEGSGQGGAGRRAALTPRRRRFPHVSAPNGRPARHVTGPGAPPSWGGRGGAPPSWGGRGFSPASGGQGWNGMILRSFPTVMVLRFRTRAPVGAGRSVRWCFTAACSRAGETLL